MNAHVWLAGPHLPDGVGTGDGPGISIEADCHRQLRGPYTGLGTVLRALVPEARGRDSELVRKHAVEILTIAPDLKDRIGAGPETLTSLAAKDERTRLYARGRTRRIAHGVADFLNACADPGRPLVLYFRNVDEADHTDQEFIAILLRRARPGRVRIIVGTRGEELSEELPAEPRADLATALREHARRVAPDDPAGARGAPRQGGRGTRRDHAELLRAYIDSEGTSDDPAEIAAYAQADPGLRAVLHDERAGLLRATGDWGLRLGAIPYHLEHGTDPASAGPVLLRALDHCTFMGFYHALIDFGMRGRAVTDPGTEMETYWYLTARTATALAILGYGERAEPLYHELRARSALPMLHIVTGYALAMLYTRHHAPERKDHDVARAYIQNAIALARLWPDVTERAFHTVFNQNGLALVEMHAGELPLALRLVSEGLDRLNHEMPADKYLLHRSVLAHNRATLRVRMGQSAEAIADFDAVIEADPNYAEYYFDRANAKRQLGDTAGALADYDSAISHTPPFWELHYNRGDLRAETGDLAGAIADFARVVELEPDEFDARLNLVGLLLETGDLADAREHLDEGLQQWPGHPQLLANRAMLAYEAADHASAIRDLTDAITAAADADLLYNRGLVYAETGQWSAAVSDFTRALDLPGADRPELLRQRGLCHAAAQIIVSTS